MHKINDFMLGGVPSDQEFPIRFGVSDIENVDAAMLDYVKDLNLHTMTPNGFESVKLTWVSPERSLAAKRDVYFRDATGALILPIIAVERTNIAKDLSKKGAVWGNVVPHDDEKGGSIKIARRIKQDKSSNFANTEARRKRGQVNFPGMRNNKIVYETISIPMPVYVEMSYKITLRTEYQQQMNQLITPFLTKPGGVNYILISKHGHRYEGFIQKDFSQNNNFASFTSKERQLETTIEIKVLAYLIGEGKNQSQPIYSIRENAVDIKIPRERIIFGDSPETEIGRFYGLAGITKLIPIGEPDQVITPFVFDRGAESTGGGGTTTTTTTTTAGTVTTTNYSPNQSFQETPNGSRTTFTVSEEFVIGTQMVFRDGILMLLGDGNDYTVTNDTTIEFNSDDPPGTNDNLVISYVKA